MMDEYDFSYSKPPRNQETIGISILGKVRRIHIYPLMNLCCVWRSSLKEIKQARDEQDFRTE